jgi:hypothetical protein
VSLANWRQIGGFGFAENNLAIVLIYFFQPIVPEKSLISV